MTDPKTGSTLYPLTLADGTVKHLPRLRPSDIRRLRNALHEERRAAVLKNAEDTIGKNNELVLKQLHEHDSRIIGRGDTIEWALSPNGMPMALALSWVQTYKPPAKDEEELKVLVNRAVAEIDEWDVGNKALVDAVAAIFNVIRTDSPNPQGPAAAAGESTTSTSPNETSTGTPPASPPSASRRPPRTPRTSP